MQNLWIWIVAITLAASGVFMWWQSAHSKFVPVIQTDTSASEALHNMPGSPSASTTPVATSTL